MSALDLLFGTNFLRLPDYKVVDCQEETDCQRHRLTVVVTTPPLCICPPCGTANDILHPTQAREPIKDLSVSDYAVHLNGARASARVPLVWLIRHARQAVVGRRIACDRTLAGTRRAVDEHQCLGQHGGVVERAATNVNLLAR